MVITAYYNKNKETLIIFTNKKSQNNKKIVLDNNFHILKNEKDEIVGINVLNYKNEKLNDGLVDNGDIKEILEKYFEDDIIEPFLVGEITELSDHPKSEKLHICQVNIGDETRQIVCGAQNVQESEKVIVANLGAIMPNGMSINPSRLIDVDSFGMLCSYRELGIENEQKVGIALLDKKLKNGSKFTK